MLAVYRLFFDCDDIVLTVIMAIVEFKKEQTPKTKLSGKKRWKGGLAKIKPFGLNWQAVVFYIFY